MTIDDAVAPKGEPADGYCYCPECWGDGTNAGDPCGRCAGSGFVRWKSDE